MAAAEATLCPIGRAGVAAITNGWSAPRIVTPGHGHGGGHNELLQDLSEHVGVDDRQGADAARLRDDGGRFQRDTDNACLPVCASVPVCVGLLSRVRLRCCVRLRFCMLVRVRVNVHVYCACACARVCRPLGAHDHDGHRGLRHELPWPVHHQGIRVEAVGCMCSNTRKLHFSDVF